MLTRTFIFTRSIIVITEAQIIWTSTRRNHQPNENYTIYRSIVYSTQWVLQKPVHPTTRLTNGQVQQVTIFQL